MSWKITPVVLIGLDEQATWAAQSERADGAAALSSYNNNNKNPRRGTDRLCGAW
jgi:hypothetical protein